MKNLNKEFDKKIMMGVWHEVDCPAHSNQMRPENECNCIYKFISKNILDFIKEREKELREEIFSRLPSKYDPMTREEMFETIDDLEKELSDE